MERDGEARKAKVSLEATLSKEMKTFSQADFSRNEDFAMIERKYDDRQTRKINK